MEDKIGKVKLVAGIVTTIGVGAIIDNAIKATTPATAGKLSRLGIWVGGLVLGGMVVCAAVNYVEKQIDSGVTWFKKVKGQVDDQKAKDAEVEA